MADLFTPLDEAEMDVLDNFLSSRVDDEQYEPGMDEGVYELSGLDGFFTAIVSGPVTILPSQWLPVLWGDFEPEWQDGDEFELIFRLLMRHMNVIAGMLLETPEDFEPLFLESMQDGNTHMIVDEWCEGYIRAVDMMPESWGEGGEAMDLYLIPIYAFTETSNWRGHELEFDEAVNLQRAIPDCVREIHKFWLARREDELPVSEPVSRSEIPVGRNDPCPCGSGRKYKKCCLH